MKTHKDLTVYRESMLFVQDVYKLTSSFPKSEMYGLTSQLRRSATSIPLNIAEGAARIHLKEKIQFINIALGSASELDTQLDLSQMLDFMNKTDHANLTMKLNQIIKMLHGFKNYHADRVTSMK